MPGTTFQLTAGVAAVQLSATAALSAAQLRAGVKVVMPAANTGLIYYGYTEALATTSNGCHIPNGVPFTINPSEMVDPATGRPALTRLWFISDTAAQKVTGVVE